MKFTTTLLTITIIALTFFSINSYGQETAEARKDSVARVEMKAQKVMDEERMNAAKNDTKETEAKAKEAQRIQADASDAAKESKSALKAEKKAQKARMSADKQAKKAALARGKSNQNQ